ncbi:MAG: hypothetical protein V4640_06785 [Verrucomicrobiota bacterium]
MVDSTVSLEASQPTGDTQAEIRNLFPSDVRPYWLELKRLVGVLICENVVANLNLEPYLTVAEKIKDSVRLSEPGNPNLQIPDWPRVVKLAMMSIESHYSDIFSGSSFRFQYVREFNFSDAVKRMTEAGYSLEQESAVSFPEEERRRMLESICQSVCQIGAYEVCSAVFRDLSQSYNKSIDRYLLGRRILQIPKAVEEHRSQIPYSMLLEICLKKMPLCKKGSAANEEDLADLFSFSADFAAIYDVQQFSQWELLFKNTHSFLEYLRELAIYDNFFHVRQLRHRDLIEFIPVLFDWVPPKIEENLGCTIVDLTNVADAILSECPPFGPFILNKSRLRGGLSKMPNGRFLKAMTILTNGRPLDGTVTLPEDTAVRTSHSFPTVTDIDYNKIVPDKRVSSYSFLTRIAMELYSHDKNAFSYIGSSAETLVKRRLSTMGIRYKSGNYKFPDVEGECDIVIETDDTLIFIEMKIKGFTLAALAGGDVHIVADVAHSLFAAAEQASRHEVTLREKGSLPLIQDDGTVYELKLEGRQVEKISLTLDDFGSFQNRSCLRELFPIFVNAQFTPFDKAHKKKLDNVNELASELNERIQALMRLTNLPSDHLFSQFWFFSVPQLFSAIEGARTSQEFADALAKLRHISFSTMDNHSEIAFAKNLASAGGASPMFFVT